jgi:hypothetical protein
MAITYPMEKSPSWDASRSSDSHEILNILRDPKVHYGTHNSPPHVPILSQIDPVHNPNHNTRRPILILSSNLHMSISKHLLSDKRVRCGRWATGVLVGMGSQLHAPAALPQEKGPKYRLIDKYGEAQGRYGSLESRRRIYWACLLTERLTRHVGGI